MLSLDIMLGYVNNMLCHAMLCYFWLGQANIRLGLNRMLGYVSYTIGYVMKIVCWKSWVKHMLG